MEVSTHQINNKKKEYSFSAIAAYSLFCLPFGLIPLIIFFSIISSKIIPDLKKWNWDDTTGTIISVDEVDTKNLGTSFEYRYILNIRYQDNGRTLTKNITKIFDDNSKASKFLGESYKGALITLKINPENRSDVVIKPNYILDILSLVIGSFIALGLFFFFCIYIPLFSSRLEKKVQDPNSLRHKFETHKFKIINYLDAELQNDRQDYNIDWSPIHGTYLGGLPLKASKTKSKLSFKQKYGCFLLIIAAFLAVGIFVMTKSLTGGLIWCILILFFTYKNLKYEKRNFDILKGYYWKGEDFKTTDELVRNNPADLTQLSQIKVLQILNYMVAKHDEGHYEVPMYELNLVLRDNTRVNVFNHGSLQEILKQADQIAEFLGVRVILDPKIDKKSYLISL